MSHPYPPAPHGPGGSGGIAITTHYFPIAFMLALFKPEISIDGYPVPVPGWGRTVVPTQPGQHRVHVHVPYLLMPQLGPADTVVDVYPGHLVELEYKAPLWGFSAGSLGSPPQEYNGVGITVAVMAAGVAVGLLFPLLMLILVI